MRLKISTLALYYLKSKDLYALGLEMVKLRSRKGKKQLA